MEIKYSITLDLAVIKKDIPKLDAFWRHEVRDTIREKLTTKPDIFGKPLHQSLRSCRSLRIGDYRVVYRIEEKIVRIIAIIHRSSDYRGVEKRL